MRKIYTLFLIIIFLLTATVNSMEIKNTNKEDIDPLVDLEITVKILKIRSLEHNDPQLYFREIIDPDSKPDFYTKIIVNGKTHTSDIKWNTRYIYDTFHTVTVDVPDFSETVDIVIQLWDAADGIETKDRLCDISKDSGKNSDSYDAEITYNLKTGRWTRDDYVGDSSGYGRLNGCDDGTIYEKDRDCELWFDITFNDYDNDGIPYYMETEEYGTDPTVNDYDTDFDNDLVPTWWEHRYGYNPKEYEDHKTLDPEQDGITNLNEYRMFYMNPDPFVRDLFLELDQMGEGPNGELSIFPEKAKEMLYTAHNRQNVIYHLDDGSYDGYSGSEFVPFDEITEFEELVNIRNNYFYDTRPVDWWCEVFHYGVLIWESSWVTGNAFGKNAFQISANLCDIMAADNGFDRDVVYASCYMHETGHNLNFRPIPGHGKTGWLLRIFLPLYKSCMSYGMIYRMVDYSDGSRPFINRFIGDYDDWERMDLTYFRDERSIPD